MAEFEHVPFTKPKKPLICAIQLDAEISTIGYSFAVDMSTIFGIYFEDSCTSNMPFGIQTCILINSDDKTFRAFGSKAEQEFKELVSKGRQRDCFFFKGFGGIDIFDDDFVMVVIDETGNTSSAIDVFAMMIHYLKDEFERCLSDTVTTDDIGWVLTLPSGSSLLFQKLMRHSAIKAGIQEELLQVITTTDAAAILFADPSFSYSMMHRRWNRPAIGTQFLTVIAGDIYVDTVVYKVEEETKVKEISSLKKGPWGITMVVRKFEQLLTEIFGQSFYESYKREMQEDWIDFMHSFKAKIMRSFNHDTVNIRLPLSLSDLLIKRTGQRPEEAIANSPYAQELNYSRSLLRISLSVFKSLFEESINKITSQILSFMTKFDVDAIFVTGKLADVDIVRNKIISSFPKTVVVFAEEMTTILHGAITAANKIKMKLLSLLPKTPVCVTSIDFGTSYSGWAYSYRNEFEESPTNAYVQYWESDSIKTEKTPTHVLIRKDRKTVEAFGYDAISQYYDLPKEEQQKFYYFRNFKMALFKKLGEKLDRNITLEDEVGLQLPAMDVFAASINFLKTNFLEKTSQELIGSLDEDNIQWVLTVPAIWSDGAKQFMREAAIKAGIKSRRLRLVLEPEAASIYCRYLHVPLEAGSDSEGSIFSSLNPGAKYMILDAGGGTVDITIHEVVSKTKVKEICAASGGNWGGTTVNDAFEKLIKSFVGEDVYTAFCKEEIEDHHDILEDFEKKKRKISPQNNRHVKMNFPLSLEEKYNTIRGRSLENDIVRSKVSSSVTLNKSKIEFKADIIKSLFKQPIDQIIFHIQNMLKSVNVDAILMVGGFSDSPMLQFAVKERFPSKKIVIPRDAVTAVLRGALIFGHRPWQITERILKYTYGIRVLRPFEKGKHPESKRISTDKGDRCIDIFDIHVQKNQRVIVGESQRENSYTPANKSQKKITFEIFASQLENPRFTDTNCTYVGKLTVDLTDHDRDLKRSVKVALTFSDTEIVVEGRDEKTGDQTCVAIDCLG